MIARGIDDEPQHSHDGHITHTSFGSPISSSNYRRAVLAKESLMQRRVTLVSPLAAVVKAFPSLSLGLISTQVITRI